MGARRRPPASLPGIEIALSRLKLDNVRAISLAKSWRLGGRNCAGGADFLKANGPRRRRIIRAECFLAHGEESRRRNPIAPDW
jgi:hypothetical protein